MRIRLLSLSVGALLAMTVIGSALASGPDGRCLACARPSGSPQPTATPGATVRPTPTAVGVGIVPGPGPSQSLVPTPQRPVVLLPDTSTR